MILFYQNRFDLFELLFSRKNDNLLFISNKVSFIRQQIQKLLRNVSTTFSEDKSAYILDILEHALR